MCVCRGCVRPGRRTVWQWLRRRPRSVAPRSHAQAILGVEHGRLHDLYDAEIAAFGVVRSAEVIQHFALPADGRPPADDDWDTRGRRGGCSSMPHWIAVELR